MATYETLVLIDPVLGDEEVTKYVHKLETLVTQRKGRLIKDENLGRKKLAYPINKKTEGSYVKLALEMPTPELREFERNLRLEPKVLRQMTLRRDG